ncbi:MAG: T9SS type A sorting domain-containing protein [Candidatus Cloacimonetes bacterium]|nr:T9SS type A sorting domain-containing protein [Candidatus Cloacimonadota bacterium]
MKNGAFFIIVVLMGVLLYGGTVEYTQSMGFPELDVNGEYLEINYDNCINIGEEGEPLLPWKGIDLLLPQDTEVTSVNIVDIEYYPVEENGVIAPSARPFPISQPAPVGYLAQPDAAIYGLDSVFPVRSISDAYTGYLSGHGIASLQFCPVEYNPVTGRVRFVKSVTIELETVYSGRAMEVEANLSDKRSVIERIERIVENPEVLAEYSYNTNERLIDYDMLLITNSDLLPYFQDYVEFKESTGFSVAVEVVENIYSNYTGIDEAAQVRSCILSYYQSYDIEYVILGGDAGNSNEVAIVPHRGFAVDDDPSLPSDMYFSNLDGTWNTDGDGNWGEQNEIDPYSEVAIGRICVDSPTEVSNAVNKLIMYQNNPVIEDIEKSVMVGEELNNNPQTNGGNYKDQIADGGYYDGYSTEGVSDNFNINYFYERDMNWNKYDLYDEFSDVGINLLNHLGHSSPTYNMKMENSDLTASNFTNNGLTRGFVIGYSQGCYNGSFDNYHYNGYYTEDCFAEKFSGGIPGGEVACIANSRYGWYMPGGTNSSSQYYDRMFFHGIFGEDISEIGKVNSYSHEDNVSMMQNNSNMRWVCYETNLFGDPSMDIWTAEPTDMIVEYPVSLPIGIDTIQLTSTEPYTRIALVQDGELIGRGVTDASGALTITTFEMINSPGLISVSGIAHNKNRFEGNIIIATDQPYVVMQSVEFDDVSGNGNGLLDYSETVDVTLNLNNVGNQTAEGVSATISTFDQNVTITDGMVDCGDISGETIEEFTAAFCLEISDEVEDQHSAVLMLEITDENGAVWSSNFVIVLNAPVLTSAYAQIDDSAGNGDGVLDAGESVIMVFPTMNTGNSATGIIDAILLSFDPWVTVETISTIIPALAVGEEGVAEFVVTINENTPEGTSVSFNYNASSGSYVTTADYNYTVGLVLEDFENGTFESYPWTFTGQQWTIDDYSYMGQYAAKSGTIGNNATTSMLIESWVRVDGTISFYKKVSCEADPGSHNFDWLAFYIDGIQQDRWDGEDPWSLEEYNISAGLHTFEWRYRKDQAVSSGSDAGWIDYIVFPPMGPPPAPELLVNVTALDVELMPDSQSSEVIELENLGVGDINYTVQIVETDAGDRDITGSQISCNADNYTPGETTGWVFELSNNSSDGEAITEVYLDFPDGITVNIATGFYGGSNPLMPDNASGNGAEIHWTSTGGVLAGEDATAGVNVTVSNDFTGEVQLDYELIGSNGGNETGTVYLFSLGLGWCNLSHNTGTIGTLGNDEVTVYFNSTGLSAGDYTAEILISDERTTITVPVLLTVVNTPVTDGDLPGTTELLGAYPNPFNPETNLKFNLAQNCNIILDIFNIRGQLVSRLAKGVYSAGEHSVRWDGKDKTGRAASSGIYFCRFSARGVSGRPDGNNQEPPEDYTTVTKIALMK